MKITVKQLKQLIRESILENVSNDENIKYYSEILSKPNLTPAQRAQTVALLWAYGQGEKPFEEGTKVEIDLGYHKDVNEPTLRAMRVPAIIKGGRAVIEMSEAKELKDGMESSENGLERKRKFMKIIDNFSTKGAEIDQDAVKQQVIRIDARSGLQTESLRRMVRQEVKRQLRSNR
jgi:hypothetical protein